MTEKDWIEVDYHSNLINTYVEISSSLDDDEPVALLRKSDSSYFKLIIPDLCAEGDALYSTCHWELKEPNSGKTINIFIF